jgi:hypothetical protein
MLNVGRLLAAALLTVGVVAPRQRPEPVTDFAFRFEYKPCAANTLDTDKNVYIREMGPGAPPISIPLTLSSEQLATVEARIDDIHLFQYPTDFKGVRPGRVETIRTSPSATYRLEVRRAGAVHIVKWDDADTPRSEEANRLLELFNLIIGFIDEHPDVKRLPRPRVVCE